MIRGETRKERILFTTSIRCTSSLERVREREVQETPFYWRKSVLIPTDQYLLDE